MPTRTDLRGYRPRISGTEQECEQGELAVGTVPTQNYDRPLERAG